MTHFRWHQDDNAREAAVPCWKVLCCLSGRHYGQHHAGLDAGRPPPLEAYGALLAEYARRRDAEAALSVLRDFCERGGTPDDQMFDTVMDLCMRTGEFRRAMQVRLYRLCEIK